MRKFDAREIPLFGTELQCSANPLGGKKRNGLCVAISNNKSRDAVKAVDLPASFGS